MPDFEIKTVSDIAEIAACHVVLLQLRPHLPDTETFVQQVQRQQQNGYRLAAAWSETQVVGVVGYRLAENLLYSRYVYVDDLVVDQSIRSGGLGARLLGFARKYAQDSGCANFVLDTGLQKSLAQKFYFRQGMLTHSIGFIEKLTPISALR